MTVETPAPSPATPSPVDRGSGRHRVVIIGSGFGGLWATGFRRSSRGRHHDQRNVTPPVPAAALPSRDRRAVRRRSCAGDP